MKYLSKIGSCFSHVFVLVACNYVHNYHVMTMLIRFHTHAPYPRRPVFAVSQMACHRPAAWPVVHAGDRLGMLSQFS